MSIIYCNQCKSSGRTNRCYITGYNIKCGHSLNWAYDYNKSGNSIIVCNCNDCAGKNNQCYITGYDYKCGHDNGWAYAPQATCYSCNKALSGHWSMENNSKNKGYFSWTTGRYLGISDGYFLYNNYPDWVYSYCKPCWIKQIQNTLPSLGIKINSNQEEISQLKNINSELQNKINNKENEINQLKKEIEKKNELIKAKDELIKSKEDEVNKLKDINKNKEEQQDNLVSAPVNSNTNSFDSIITQKFADLEIIKIKDLLKSSGFDEISELDKLFSSQNISLKIIKKFNNICQLEIKETIKEVIEKIDKSIEKTKISIEKLSLIFDEVKKKLSSKEIPENVYNESIIPLKKYIDEVTKKIEKMKDIKEEIYKINLKLIN